MTNLCTCGPLNAVQTCFGCISIICEILIYVSSVHGTFPQCPQCPFIIHLNRVIITNRHATFIGYVHSNHHVWMFGRQIRCNSWTLFGNLLNTTLTETNCLSRIPLFHLGKWYMCPTGIQRNKSIVIIANKYWYIAIAWCIHIGLSLKAGDHHI